MSEDFYPAGTKAPGVDGQFREWIPGPEVKTNVPKPTQSETEAVTEAMAAMDGAVPYEKAVHKGGR